MGQRIIGKSMKFVNVRIEAIMVPAEENFLLKINKTPAIQIDKKSTACKSNNAVISGTDLLITPSL